MPNYEYQCTKCDNRFELWQEVGSAAPECPECHSEVKKIFHVPRVIFKGSGFYVTDLRAEKAAQSSDKGGSSEGSSTDSGSSSSTSETKTESKTETKSEGKSETKPDSGPATKPTAAPAPVGSEKK